MVVLLMPLMQMALLGYGVNLDIKHVPICVFDREGSQQSESLMKAFQASPYFNDRRDGARLRRASSARSTRGRCKMAVVIPPDFSQDLATTNSASVQAILDATDDNTANIALGYAQAVVATFSSNVQAQRTAEPRAAAAESPGGRAIPGVVQRGSREPRLHHPRRRRDRARARRRAADLAHHLARVGARHDGGAGVDAGHPHGADDRARSLPYFFIGMLDAALCLAIAVFWFEAPFRGAVFDAVRHDVALPHRRARRRLFHFREHPQPDRREPDRARS